MVNEYSIGKLKIGLTKKDDVNILVEYDVDGEVCTDTVKASDFMAFLRSIYESLKGYRVEGIGKKPEKHFDKKTLDRLKKMGINDFEYLTRGMD